jgi:uncharacterized protein involved in high-affinity Fe2+ transport
MSSARSLAAAVAFGLPIASGAVGLAWAQHQHGQASSGAGATGTAPGAPGPRRVSEAELHRYGTPRGWKFSLPPGNPGRGRELFRELECYKCHEIKTESFPASPDGKYAGPELTGMGSMHPIEYIAESILYPNAVIVDEPGTTGPDGLSLMPSYADSLTLEQWTDLSTYLKSLREGGEHTMEPGIERVATAGQYRVRLVYAQGHGMGGHGAGHLMAYITEPESGQAVPYLPVSARVQGPGNARRTIPLRPMIGEDGLHYGADVALPRQTSRLTILIGPTTARVSGAAKGRFAKPATADFDWSADSR